jgi:hypothetical protein
VVWKADVKCGSDLRLADVASVRIAGDAERVSDDGYKIRVGSQFEEGVADRKSSPSLVARCCSSGTQLPAIRLGPYRSAGRMSMI